MHYLRFAEDLSLLPKEWRWERLPRCSICIFWLSYKLFWRTPSVVPNESCGTFSLPHFLPYCNVTPPSLITAIEKLIILPNRFPTKCENIYILKIIFKINKSLILLNSWAVHFYQWLKIKQKGIFQCLQSRTNMIICYIHH